MMPRDLQIWNFLTEHYPELKGEAKDKVCQLLEKTAVPITDKVYPWVVEGIISRVQLGYARQDMKAFTELLQGLPVQVGEVIEERTQQSLGESVQGSQALMLVIQELMLELKRSDVVNASLSVSGWKGIGAAIGAIFRKQNLAVVVGVISLVSMGIGGLFVWNMTKADRRVLEFNREVIKRCHRDYAADEDLNGWYTCPKFQVPMPEQVDEAE